MPDATTHILHMDLDTFFVSVERLLDPKLNGKPVIVGGNPYGRGVVAGCSYEARAFGVHSAQPIRQAFRLCPTAAFLHGNYLHYAEYSKLVSELLRELTPVCERASVDEFYLDLSRCERLTGNAYEWAQSIQHTVQGETELPISFGLAANKLIAKVATTEVAKKGAARHHTVELGREREFLSPFPIRALPGIGAVSEEQLEAYGIRRIGQIAELPSMLLQRLFGKTGQNLHQRANGIDHSPVITTREQQTYSRERTFGADTLDPEFLFSQLLSIASELASDLRAAKILTQKLTVKLRYTDFQTVTKTLSCSWTNEDRTIYKLAEKLFRAVYTRRVKVRLLGIEAHSLLPDLEQEFLFTETKPFNPVYATIDLLKEKYGKKIIGFAATHASASNPDVGHAS